MNYLMHGGILVLSVALNASFAFADPIVKWEEIVGIISPGTVVGGLQGVGVPWFVKNGKAHVDLGSGAVRFSVKGLVLAGQPPITIGVAAIGTPGFVTQVKGTLVCDATATTSTFVDTDAVPLDREGNADFSGSISVPAQCLLTPNLMAFLLRVADPDLIPSNRWLAHGAVRTP